MGPCCFTWKSYEKAGAAWGLPREWIFRTRNKEPLSEPAVPGGRKCGTWQLQDHAVPYEAHMRHVFKNGFQPASNPHVQVPNPLMCHVLKTSTLFQPFRFSWRFLVWPSGIKCVCI